MHEAISEVDGEEGKVVSVVQKGYKLGDRVIRPAMVVVGKGGGEQKESIDGEENGGDAQNNETEGPADA